MFKLEYIWIDGTEPTAQLRSKTKVVEEFNNNLTDCPVWGFDGSSTLQAEGSSSDCVLYPAFVCKNPLEKNAILVASYGTCSTGINIRNIHNIIFASPSKSVIRVLQSIGRGLRKSDNKENVKLYDISDDLCFKKYKNHTLRHLDERIKIYSREGFNYKNISIKI